MTFLDFKQQVAYLQARGVILNEAETINFLESHNLAKFLFFVKDSDTWDASQQQFKICDFSVLVSLYERYWDLANLLARVPFMWENRLKAALVAVTGKTTPAFYADLCFFEKRVMLKNLKSSKGLGGVPDFIEKFGCMGHEDPAVFALLFSGMPSALESATSEFIKPYAKKMQLPPTWAFVEPQSFGEILSWVRSLPLPLRIEIAEYMRFADAKNQLRLFWEYTEFMWSLRNMHAHYEYLFVTRLLNHELTAVDPLLGKRTNAFKAVTENTVPLRLRIIAFCLKALELCQYKSAECKLWRAAIVDWAAPDPRPGFQKLSSAAWWV